jgi:hypothetical protein
LSIRILDEIDVVKKKENVIGGILNNNIVGLILMLKVIEGIFILLCISLKFVDNRVFGEVHFLDKHFIAFLFELYFEFLREHKGSETACVSYY